MMPASREMITKEGNTTPMVATNAADDALLFLTTKVAVLTAINAGGTLANGEVIMIPLRSTIFCGHHLPLQHGQHGIAAAKVITPILAKVRNKSSSNFI